ncbi:putative bifunctional diguanylate cyclase/phosphodiesterase [Paenibacillus methanolicus]|uniref:Diguanylate cyclase (GGDEF)-like protein n=1 Tax=Paenibacillus methanolicus TaxID=582686 RepID=A0A5S5BWP5_9BACL|nr:bifunctional diguanylate cyclase/phosphodiesterase [Paenibacillus methanolicus]TYP70716.1 diguanylate cyclase (GGDEF)-like protein [Paenibacillus methanolicus]
MKGMDAGYPVWGWLRNEQEQAGVAPGERDLLTGLPGRLAAFTLLEQVIARAKSARTDVVVAVVDFDRFHLINESKGTVFGDQTLRLLAERFKTEELADFTACRIGGNTFVLFKPCLLREESNCIARLKTQAEAPLVVEGHVLYPTCSIGIAEYPKNGRSAERLLRHADTAMQQAKAAGGNRIGAYTEADATRAGRRLKLEGELRGALERHELSLRYQPIYAASGRLRGFEALLRWNHPELGAVSPAEFVPLAEQTGLIVPIGEWVIREACRMQRETTAKGHADIVMAVNLSPVQLRVPSFVDGMLRLLEECGVPASGLELEITESIMLEAGETTIASLDRLRQAGVRIALDDFGTGYASLTYLRELPIHTLKLDRSFIHPICHQHTERVIVESMISLVHRLGLEVVAEGIEDEDQLALLREWGCDLLQGYLLGRPIEARGMDVHLPKLA